MIDDVPDDDELAALDDYECGAAERNLHTTLEEERMDDYEKSLQRAKKLLAECGAENLADILLQAHSDRDRLTDITLVVAKHSLPPGSAPPDASSSPLRRSTPTIACWT